MRSYASQCQTLGFETAQVAGGEKLSVEVIQAVSERACQEKKKTKPLNNATSYDDNMIGR